MNLSTSESTEREAVLSHVRTVLESLLPSETTEDICADIKFATDSEIHDKNACTTVGCRDDLRLWRLLGEALSGSPTGRLPPVDLPKPFQGIEKPYSMMKEYMDQIDDVKEREGGFLSKVRLDAVGQTLDWSLSTRDPILRSSYLVDICDDIKKRQRMEKVDVLGGDYFLSGWDCDVEKVVETVLHLTETVHEKEEDPTPDKSVADNSPPDVGMNTSRRLVLDQMVQCVEKNRPVQEGLQQNSSSIELLAFPENQSGATEELLFQVPVLWVEMMRQCLNILTSCIQWDRIREEEKSLLKRASFCDSESTSRVFHEFCQRGLCDGKLLKECIIFCRTLIHKGLRAVVKSEARFEELAGFVRGISEGAHASVHPKVQVLRNTVITFSTLMPNTRQLVLCGKADWPDLFECLRSVRISIFQLSFPHHLHIIESDDMREFLMDYDCFFITVKDAEMVNQRLAAKGIEFFKHFQRVILFESEPMMIESIDKTLELLCKNGLFFCRMKPDLSLLLCVEEPGAGSSKGLPKEDANLPDGFDVSRALYESNDIHPNNHSKHEHQGGEKLQEDAAYQLKEHISPFAQGPPPQMFGTLFQEHQEISHQYKSPGSNYSMGIKENKNPLGFQDCVPGQLFQGTENLFDNHSSSFLSLEAPCAIDRHSGIVREGPYIDTLHQYMPQIPPPSYAIHDDVQNLFQEPFPSQAPKYSPMAARYDTYNAESTPQGHKMLYNGIPRYTSPVFEHSPYAQAMHHPPSYLHHISPGISPIQQQSVPQFATPPHKITPTGFWPPAMDPMNGLKHVERLYEEMRRPKSRRRLQKGEKFRKLK